MHANLASYAKRLFGDKLFWLAAVLLGGVSLYFGTKHQQRSYDLETLAMIAPCQEKARKAIRAEEQILGRAMGDRDITDLPIDEGVEFQLPEDHPLQEETVKIVLPRSSANEANLIKLEQTASNLKRRLGDDWPCSDDSHDDNAAYCEQLSRQALHPGVVHKDGIRLQGQSISRGEKKAAIERLDQAIENGLATDQEAASMLEAENCAMVIHDR